MHTKNLYANNLTLHSNTCMLWTLQRNFTLHKGTLYESRSWRLRFIKFKYVFFSNTNASIDFRRLLLTSWSCVEHFLWWMDFLGFFKTPFTAIIKLGRARTFFFKAAVHYFFGLKIVQNLFLGKYITSQCSKLSPYLSLIHNGKLVILFSNLSGTGRYGGKYKHAAVRLCDITSRL